MNDNNYNASFIVHRSRNLASPAVTELKGQKNLIRNEVVLRLVKHQPVVISLNVKGAIHISKEVKNFMALDIP